MSPVQLLDGNFLYHLHQPTCIWGRPMKVCPRCEADPRSICFKHKIRTLQFGIVPGAYSQSSSDSYYDTEALKDGNFPTNEEIRDTQSDVRHILSEVDD
jgi:hypothetical protein